MNRTLLRFALGIVALVAVGLGLAWARPDLLAALRQLRPAAAPAEEQTREVALNASAQTKIELADDGWCLPHQQPEVDCRDCTPEQKAAGPCHERLPVLRLATPEIARKIGLVTAAVESRMHADTLVGNAEVVYNANTYAEVRPRVGGLIGTIETDEGHFHHKGDVLAIIDSAEVGTAKAQFLAVQPVVTLAEATLKRTEELTRANALPLKDELEASTALNRAKAELLNASQRLRNLGFQEKDLAEIEKNKDTSSLLRIVSPIEGTIVTRHAVTGEAVESIHQLFVVADIRVMWAWIDVYEAEIDRVKAEQKVTFRIGGLEDRGFEGHVDWIDAAVNPTTRTIRVRAEIDNPDGRLRANQFGKAEIVVGKPHEAVLVPRQAIQSNGAFQLVFLPRPDGSYHAQRVTVEDRDEFVPGMVEVAWGVKSGDRVVTTGSFLLKSELMKKLESLATSE